MPDAEYPFGGSVWVVGVVFMVSSNPEPPPLPEPEPEPEQLQFLMFILTVVIQSPLEAKLRVLLYLCMIPLFLIATYYLMREYVRLAKSVTNDKTTIAVLVFFMTIIHFLIMAMFMMWV